MKIAIMAKLRSGKDEVAKYIMKKVNCEHFKFSTGITEIINEYLPDMKNTKNRMAYQHIGQELRALDPNVWLNRVVREYRLRSKSNEYYDSFIISDVRQPNEYHWCVENGFTMIKIVCNDEIRFRRAKESRDVFNEEDLKHDTESYIDDYKADFIIYNNGTIEELYNQIDKILECLEEDNMELKDNEMMCVSKDCYINVADDKKEFSVTFIKKDLSHITLNKLSEEDYVKYIINQKYKIDL